MLMWRVSSFSVSQKKALQMRVPIRVGRSMSLSMSTAAKSYAHRNYPVAAYAVGTEASALNAYATAPAPATSTASHAHRHQHHLALVNTEHREAMRILILSLQSAAAACSFPNQTVPAPAPAPPYMSTAADADIDINIDIDANTDDTVNANTNSCMDIHIQESSVSTSQAATAKLRFALQKALSRHDRRGSLLLFESALKQNVSVDLKQAIELFFLVSETDPIASYSVLQYCNAHPHSKGPKVEMYRQLCTSIRLLDPRASRPTDLQHFVESLMLEVNALDMYMKKKLHPILVLSLAEQRSCMIGPYARFVYQYMIDNDFRMRPGWLKALLNLSKYNRQEDVPFHDVLARLVQMQQYPHPHSTMQAVHNMFPFTDAKKMNIALEAISTTLREARNSKHSNLHSRHLIDIATLESISAGAAHIGSKEMITHVWDIIDQSEFNPSEVLFENTIIALASSDDGLREAFTALAEMKRQGFEVSRPLIRSFSRAIRSYKPRVTKALGLLTDYDGSLVSLESLNIILSSYAERGNVLDALHVLDIMRRYGLKPNADSYSFAVEVLGKDLVRRNKVTNFAWVQKTLDTADAILTKMEEEEIAPSPDVIRNYVELLCIAGELSTATSVVDDCMSRERRFLINNKTLYRLAMANADAGNFEIANRLASLTSEVIPVLHRKITAKEQRHFHLEQS